MAVTGDYREISTIARKRRDASIAAYYNIADIDEAKLPNDLTTYSLSSGYYTTDELEIIQCDAEDILDKIRDRIWTSLEVTKAFCKASALAQKLTTWLMVCQRTNCVTEVLYPEAFERAQYLDDYIEKRGTTVGPLHGLPISLKDCFITAPHPSSIGMAAFANERLDKDSLIVNVLRDLGAVFYIKTNVPVAMMMMETNNNVWGETRNPLHKGLSPGGSSGGEGALIALKASPLGIGTDIGGSVRIPAGWCHLYGLKPSFGRYPTYGGKSGIPGQEYILAVNGPMSTSLRSLQLYSEAMLSEKSAPWDLDHKCLPIPWRKDVIQPKGRKLRLGLVGSDDGLITCHPPVERALKLTKAALEKAGHEVITWDTADHAEITKNVLAAFFDLGGSAIMDYLTPYGEPIYPSMQGYAAASQAGENDLGPTKMRMMNMKRNAIQKAYLDRWQQTAADGKAPVDGVIMALSPWAAPRLGQTQKDFYVGYTSVWNFLDFPACTFPVTLADKEADPARHMKSFAQKSELDAKIQAEYDPDFYHGAPVSLQLAGKRLEEEKVLEMVAVIADALKRAS